MFCGKASGGKLVAPNGSIGCGHWGKAGDLGRRTTGSAPLPRPRPRSRPRPLSLRFPLHSRLIQECLPAALLRLEPDCCPSSPCTRAGCAGRDLELRAGLLAFIDAPFPPSPAGPPSGTCRAPAAALSRRHCNPNGVTLLPLLLRALCCSPCAAPYVRAFLPRQLEDHRRIDRTPSLAPAQLAPSLATSPLLDSYERASHSYKLQACAFCTPLAPARRNGSRPHIAFAGLMLPRRRAPRSCQAAGATLLAIAAVWSSTLPLQP